ncbi:MAG: flavin-containing monooxygenase [Burkholderiales bacterium]
MLEVVRNPGTALPDEWFKAFGQSVSRADNAGMANLFHLDCHWRDALALTWHLTNVSGADKVACALSDSIKAAGAWGFAIDPTRTPPREVTRVGQRTIEAIFRFETPAGRCSGVLRMLPDGVGQWKAWTIFTSLEELKGFEERIGKNRPTGASYAREFHGPNWLDLRRVAMAYADRDPAVLVVGGGQAGLSVAARLSQLQVGTLIVDREARIGDNWRRRYHALTLHNQIQVNHLPYVPFPPTWPTYVPKDKLANWFEAYVETMELNFWTGTELVGGAYDEAHACWSVRVRRFDGSTRTLRPRHVVMATGANGIPNLPGIPGLAEFCGKVVHSSGYEDGEAWRGKRAIVVGTGNSGHDIAQDLHSSGAHVTLVQRSPTLVVSIEPSGQLAYAMYNEGPPLEDCDLIASATPWPLARRTHYLLTEQSKRHDRALLEGLERAGFELDYGPDGTGWQFKFLTRGGGYYFNVGCSDLIVEGKVRVVQFRNLERFDAAGARMRDGSNLPADLVVLATGYLGQEHLVRKLFGGKVAARVGPVWGFGSESEIRNMYTRTPQPGLWFIAGGLAQCRINSKYLALQIKACEEGMIPLVRA